MKLIIFSISVNIEIFLERSKVFCKRFCNTKNYLNQTGVIMSANFNLINSQPPVKQLGVSEPSSTWKKRSMSSSRLLQAKAINQLSLLEQNQQVLHRKWLSELMGILFCYKYSRRHLSLSGTTINNIKYLITE